jgi:amino acid transporter
MSDRVGLLLKMLLPSVAISIAINYFGTNLTLEPNDSIALIAVFVPSIVMGIALWVRG